MVSKVKVLLAASALLNAAALAYALKAAPTGVPAELAVEKCPDAEAASEHPLINKSVTMNSGKHFIINFKPLRQVFEAVQAKYPQKTYVYFNYLNNASWIGIGEREEFTAASTLKVPVAMALLKAVEDGKVNLHDRHQLAETDIDSGFGELYKMGAGAEFAAAELMEIMLEHSDNTATNGVISVLKSVGIGDPLAATYGFLGWDMLHRIPELGETPRYAQINLKTLSNLFIALYDAKYLSIRNSELILKHLSETEFDDGIVAGVPKGITVSHKIGTAPQDNTFTDCGIVYAPNRHYLLCIASNGASEHEARRFMAEISKAAYDYVISN